MEDNIQLLQLLPHLLAEEGRQAFVVFCDFKKDGTPLLVDPPTP
jgi:hypothetical protein